MTTQRSKDKERKNPQRPEKTLSMEEKSPTMPRVFCKFLNITGSYSNCRDVIYYVEPKNDERPPCPQCGGECYAHGAYRRVVWVMNAEGDIRKCQNQLTKYSTAIIGSQNTDAANDNIGSIQ